MLKRLFVDVFISLFISLFLRTAVENLPTTMRGAADRHGVFYFVFAQPLLCRSGCTSDNRESRYYPGDKAAMVEAV